MAQIKNISTGPRGAYLKGVLTMVEVGETVDADDFAKEWFEEVKASKAKQDAKAE